MTAFMMRTGYAVLTSVLLLSMAASTVSPSEAGQTWTIMVYMAADVDSELPWLQDLNEMEAAEASVDLQVIALVDPPGTGDTQMLLIEHDPDFFDPALVSTQLDDGGSVIPGGGEVNTGSANTLGNFIVFCEESYPADRFVLVLWGHGAGWRGICPDGYDLLTLPELDIALGMAEEETHRGLDMIVLDICDGSNLELAYEVHEHSDLLLAGEQLVPADGLPYRDVLDALVADTSQTAEEFGVAAADAYAEWAEYGSSYATSMTLVDLASVAGLVESLDVVSSLGTRFDRLYHEDLVSAIESSAGTDEWNPDLGSLLYGWTGGGLPLELRLQAMETGERYHRSIAHFAQSQDEGTEDGYPDMLSGMVVYAPSDLSSDASYLELDISATSWDELALLLRLEADDSESGAPPYVAAEDSLTDADDQPDHITVEWPSDAEWNYTGYAVYAYSVLPYGIAFLQGFESVTPIMRISDASGRVLLSLSGLVDDVAYSYSLVETVLPVTFELDVTLTGAGATEAATYELRLSSSDGGEKVAAFEDGVCTMLLPVPSWAEVGEVVRLQVVDLGSGATVAEKSIRVPSQGTLSVSMEVLGDGAEEDLQTQNLLVLTAAATLLGIAAVVYWNLLRR